MLKRIGVFGAWAALAFLAIAPSIAGRNGSGSYTIPNTFVSGGTITASGQNTNFTDIATELTNSVAADGQTSMTGPLKASSGSAAAPSYTFSSETTSGFFRKALNSIGISIAGTEVGHIDATGLTLNSGATVPSGTVFPYAGSSAPTGYLLAQGQAVSRTTYAALFAVVATTYGVGDGSTTFNLPDLTGRTVAGKEAAATRLTSAVSGVDGATLGAAGGAQSHTLTTAEMPSHTHVASVTDPGHTHHLSGANSSVGASFAGILSNLSSPGTDTDSATTGITVSNANTGGGTAHAIVQPTIILNYIIKI